MKMPRRPCRPCRQWTAPTYRRCGGRGATCGPLQHTASTAVRWHLVAVGRRWSLCGAPRLVIRHLPPSPRRDKPEYPIDFLARSTSCQRMGRYASHARCRQQVTCEALTDCHLASIASTGGNWLPDQILLEAPWNPTLSRFRSACLNLVRTPVRPTSGPDVGMRILDRKEVQKQTSISPG